jgi:hypothetical protein
MKPEQYLALAVGWILAIFIAALAIAVLRLVFENKIDLSRLISEPNGDASMSRFQLLIFTFVIALSLFLVVIGNGATPPVFPEIPGTVLSLLGISASSYLVSKGIQFSNDEGVKDRPPVVQISPQSVDLLPGQSKSFTATVSRSENQSVTWSINPQVGSISASGVYTAPAMIDQPELHVEVQAVSAADALGIGKASIKLTPHQAANG